MDQKGASGNTCCPSLNPALKAEARVWVAVRRKNAVGTLDTCSNQCSSESAVGCKNFSGLTGCKRGSHVCLVCFTAIQHNALE